MSRGIILAMFHPEVLQVGGIYMVWGTKWGRVGISLSGVVRSGGDGEEVLFSRCFFLRSCRLVESTWFGERSGIVLESVSLVSSELVVLGKGYCSRDVSS